MKIQVIIAKKAGACAGVKRALQLAYECATRPGFASTLEALIHNPKVNNELKEMGVHLANTIDEIETEAVIIRCHGVTPEVLKELENRNLEIIDATCPNVTRVHTQASILARKYGITLIVGDETHPEVVGICGCVRAAKGEVYVCKSAEGIPSLLAGLEIGVVVQTTESEKNLKDVLDRLEKMHCKVHLKNTICHATRVRQAAAATLSSRVDVMIVLGGRNSANTVRLTEICAENCKDVLLIQNLKEIDHIDFHHFLPEGRGFLKIGITAGASTPVSQIKACLEKLEELD
ncbi:MAG: 4-hydroxy-3-methylbut-2-enyl diphosphate reductase [Eggerthellaceae bacterium]|nr:4-hydroxy-3-methylbut-2-enyl diphosphate reductase [Eggerthellaceae bacterium]